jgi:hypothetical protein
MWMYFVFMYPFVEMFVIHYGNDIVKKGSIERNI